MRGRIEFVGFGAYRPEREELVSTRQFLQRQGELERPLSSETIAAVGIEQRIETAKPILELARLAAEEAIADASKRDPNFARSKLAAVVSGGSCPERLYPATACCLQQALGLSVEQVAFGYDVSAACCSWSHAVGALRNQMLTNDYPLPYGLVCIPDRTNMDVASPKDRNAFLWGAGAGATVLAYNPQGASDVGLLSTASKMDGDLADWIIARGVGTGRQVRAEECNVDLGRYGARVQRYIFAHVPSLIRQQLDQSGFEVNERTWLVPHNANLRMVNHLGELLGLPENRVLTRLRERGNTSGASIPITLAHYVKQEMFRSGDLLIIAAFGAGMMMQTILYRWP